MSSLALVLEMKNHQVKLMIKDVGSSTIESLRFGRVATTNITTSMTALMILCSRECNDW